MKSYTDGRRGGYRITWIGYRIVKDSWNYCLIMLGGIWSSQDLIEGEKHCDFSSGREVATSPQLVNMSTQTQWHWNLLPSVILIEILSYLPLSDKISACSTCKAWRSALFHPSFWRKIELVFKSSDWSRLERSRFVASWGARKLRSCILQLETVNTSCLVEADHVLLKLTRNPQVSAPLLCVLQGMNQLPWGEFHGLKGMRFSRLGQGRNDLCCQWARFVQGRSLFFVVCLVLSNCHC